MSMPVEILENRNVLQQTDLFFRFLTTFEFILASAFFKKKNFFPDSIFLLLFKI